MANVNVSLSLGNNAFSKGKAYRQVFENTQEVDNTDGFINLLSVSGTKGTATVPSIKAFCVYNEGDIPAEIQFIYQEWKNNSNTDDANAVDTGGGSTNLRYITMALPAGDFFYLPHGRVIGYNTDASAANATTIENTAPNALMFVDSVANLAAPVDDVDTSITVNDGDFFKVNDLIQLGVDNSTTTKLEIMEVTAISGAVLTVKRGLYGSNINDKDAQTDATEGVVSGANVYFPFFNKTADFDKFSVSQTDKNGIFHAMNFFGYGRTADAISDGIQAGSIGIKFYSAGYQELGLSGITPNTNSGLAASATYKFNITLDGGSAFADLTFITDSSNLNFGGKNGVINKIQDALNTQYYTAGNLFEKRVTVSLIGGDVRFTSGQHLSGSAILLAAPSSGVTPFGVGRLPAIGAVEGAVAAKLPDDTIYNRITYDASPNKGAFMYDDGQGNLVGAANGRINYETGEIRFTGLPNAEFVVNLIHKSAHAGGVNSDTSAGKNTIQSIGARSINPKLNTTVKILAYN